jgi:hypothetical protein
MSVLAAERGTIPAWSELVDCRSAAAIEYYATREGISLEHAEAHFIEVLKFLFLVRSFPDDKLTPSARLDEMWHAFILQTRDYERFSKLLGRFIHHTTTFIPQICAYNNALGRYRQAFGTPPCVWNSSIGECETDDGDTSDPGGCATE